MSKSHARGWMGFAVAFVALLYSCLLFMLKPALDISAWTLYAFTMIAFLLLILQTVIGSGGVKAMPNFDIINTVVAVVYAAAQLAIGGVVLMLFEGLPFVPVAVVESVVLAAYLVYTFVFSAVTSHANKQDSELYAPLADLRLMSADLETMAAQQPEGELRRKLHEAAQVVRFQDVKVPAELAPLDESIMQCVRDIRSALDRKDEGVFGQIGRLRRLLDERTMKSRALKR